ncbi:MAG: nucleoside/nucleotide kinase family protein [Acidimicrobiales bacterium]
MFVVVGPGGVGKGTVIRRLLARDHLLWLSRSWTTRARRPGEVEDAYHFVDRETFMRRVGEGGFLEWASVLDHLYGTPIPEPPAGCDVLLEIDVQGARQVMAAHPDATAILLLAPSAEVQEARLRTRGDSEQHVQRRIALGQTEEREGRDLAAHVVVNDDLESAVEQLSAIIDAARSDLARP